MVKNYLVSVNKDSPDILDYVELKSSDASVKRKIENDKAAQSALDELVKTVKYIVSNNKWNQNIL